MSIEGLGPMQTFDAHSVMARHQEPIPTKSPTYGPPVPTQGPTAPAATSPKAHDVDAAADRVMNAGVRTLIKDNYEQRMDRFAQEMSKGNSAFRAALLSKILDKDPNAFGSWLHADRMNWMVKDKDISTAERDAVNNGMLNALNQNCDMHGGKLGADYIRQTNDPKLIAAYIQAQNLDDRDGFNRALKAFSGLQPQDVGSFVNGGDTRGTMQNFSMACSSIRTGTRTRRWTS
jgi:hypothetical protein